MAAIDQVSRSTARETYRSLLLRGLTAGEAGNLTAFLSGIAVDGGRPWRIADVERLLFLRELCRSGRIGSDDGLEPVEAPTAVAA